MEEDHVNVAGNSTHANSKSKQALPRAYRPYVPSGKERTRGSSATAKLAASGPIKLQAAREDPATDFFAKTTRPSNTAKRTSAEELATSAGHEDIHPLTEEVVLDGAAARKAALLSQRLGITTPSRTTGEPRQAQVVCRAMAGGGLQAGQSVDGKGGWPPDKRQPIGS